MILFWILIWALIAFILNLFFIGISRNEREITRLRNRDPITSGNLQLYRSKSLDSETPRVTEVDRASEDIRESN